jgi:hypothetical protein
MTNREIEIANAIDEMPVGGALEINGVRVERRDAELYAVGGRRLCFMEVYDLLTGR